MEGSIEPRSDGDDDEVMFVQTEPMLFIEENTSRLVSKNKGLSDLLYELNNKTYCIFFGLVLTYT